MPTPASACAGVRRIASAATGCNLRFIQDDIRNFGRPGFRGAIDEMYLFSRALRVDEVQALMLR